MYSDLPQIASLLWQSSAVELAAPSRSVGGIYWVGMTSRPGILKPQTMLPAYQPSHRRRSAPIELERRTALRQCVMLPMVIEKRVAADAAEH